MADFAIDKNKLNQVNQEKDVNGWKELGGVERVAALLKTNAKEGLSSSSVARNREAFGSNAFKEVPPRTFLSMLLDTLKDPTLILLMCAATVSTILGSGALFQPWAAIHVFAYVGEKECQLFEH
jgi:magnesium-transporting ATPase (P-type)